MKLSGDSGDKLVGAVAVVCFIVWLYVYYLLIIGGM
jgi:hypothetical protein